ncbi:hypothetical protein GCM10023323_15220 [Streptomyces thinghirensis]|uniref:Uncharacterized protein n=1 Tax=Streptomyces thinghirensis TaxID=551547 RepID=A0ABP9T0K6_9ACTN
MAADHAQATQGSSPPPPTRAPGEVPLSRLEYFPLWASVPPGASDAEVTVPTIRDEVTEPTEYIGFRTVDDEGEPQGPLLTGTVLDAS